MIDPKLGFAFGCFEPNNLYSLNLTEKLAEVQVFVNCHASLKYSIDSLNVMPKCKLVLKIISESYKYNIYTYNFTTSTIQ